MARPHAKTSIAVFPTHCKNCGERIFLQKMFVAKDNWLEFNFCKKCVHSLEEALDMQTKIILASRPAPPKSPIK